LSIGAGAGREARKLNPQVAVGPQVEEAPGASDAARPQGLNDAGEQRRFDGRAVAGEVMERVPVLADGAENDLGRVVPRYRGD